MKKEPDSSDDLDLMILETIDEMHAEAQITRTLPTPIFLLSGFDWMSATDEWCDDQRAQSATIKIPSVPFNIIALRTYVLTGNLT